MALASKSSLAKSLDNSQTKFPSDAPNALRMPTSLVRCRTASEAKPNNPKQEMTMANKAE